MDDLQQRIIRAMTPERKLRIADELYQTAWALKTAGIRMRHPDWSEEQVRRAVRDVFLHGRT